MCLMLLTIDASVTWKAEMVTCGEAVLLGRNVVAQQLACAKILSIPHERMLQSTSPAVSFHVETTARHEHGLLEGSRGGAGKAGPGRTAAISHFQSRTPAGQGVHWLSGVGWRPAVRRVTPVAQELSDGATGGGVCTASWGVMHVSKHTGGHSCSSGICWERCTNHGFPRDSVDTNHFTTSLLPVALLTGSCSGLGPRAKGLDVLRLCCILLRAAILPLRGMM